MPDSSQQESSRQNENTDTKRAARKSRNLDVCARPAQCGRNQDEMKQRAVRVSESKELAPLWIAKIAGRLVRHQALEQQSKRHPQRHSDPPVKQHGSRPK